MKRNKGKIFFGIIFFGIVFLSYFFDLTEILSLEVIKNSYQDLRQLVNENNIKYSLATRLLWDESEDKLRENFSKFITDNNLKLDAKSKTDLVTFTEMDESKDTPEITTACWGILNKNPEEVMCSWSRMVVKKKDKLTPTVIACTLLPYDENFDLGETLTNSMKKIYLNHKHCSKFCVLGGSSCS